MKIYLAGPMRGIPEFNYPTFRVATARLRAMGHVVFSPVEHDEKTYGINISNSTGDADQAAREHGFNINEALHADLKCICLEAEAVVLLPGWENSKGANAERATALALGKPVLTIDAFSEEKI